MSDIFNKHHGCVLPLAKMMKVLETLNLISSKLPGSDFYLAINRYLEVNLYE